MLKLLIITLVFFSLIDEVESTRGLGKSKSNTKYSLDWNDYYDHDTINEVTTILF